MDYSDERFGRLARPYHFKLSKFREQPEPILEYEPPQKIHTKVKLRISTPAIGQNPPQSLSPSRKLL
jgi:hypothetical protein